MCHTQLASYCTVLLREHFVFREIGKSQICYHQTIIRTMLPDTGDLHRAASSLRHNIKIFCELQFSLHNSSMTLTLNRMNKLKTSTIQKVSYVYLQGAFFYDKSLTFTSVIFQSAYASHFMNEHKKIFLSAAFFIFKLNFAVFFIEVNRIKYSNVSLISS